jgi:hypothetical protein
MKAGAPAADRKGMDVAAASVENSQGSLTEEVGVTLLRKQLDTAQSSAAQLLSVLPRPSLEPNKGSQFDAYA